MDIAAINPGEDFVEVLEKAVGACDVLIAVIGKHWLDITDKAGKRRLDNPNDFVRIEVATALRRNIRIIPVLVDDAQMPNASDLPDDLAKLARRSALEISEKRFRHDTEQLIAGVEKALNPVNTAKPAAEGSTVDDEFPGDEVFTNTDSVPSAPIKQPFNIDDWSPTLDEAAPPPETAELSWDRLYSTIYLDFEPIIEANTALPQSIFRSLFTQTDNQRFIRFNLHYRDIRLGEHYSPLGTFDVNLPELAPAGALSILIGLEVNKSLILRVVFRDRYNFKVLGEIDLKKYLFPQD
jgi:hypothetical protein